MFTIKVQYITGCAVAQALCDSLEIRKWQNSTPHRIKTLQPIAKNIVMGDQISEETRSAKFGADQSTGVCRGDMPIFQLSYTPFFLQPTYRSERWTNLDTRYTRRRKITQSSHLCGLK